MARETHDLGHLYVHTMRVPTGGPVAELGTSHEVEEPWRVGRCVVLRLWKLALVVGWWGPGRTLAEMLKAEGEEAYAHATPAFTKPMIDQIREDFLQQPAGDDFGPMYEVR